MLELPHTNGCLVCGRTNPHGLKMSLHVDPATGHVHSQLATRNEHVGFDGIIHGGILATIIDEAMVWCATWQGKRFCVAAEMNVRFVRPVSPGMTIRVKAKIDSARPRLVTTSCAVTSESGEIVCTGAGKYMPVTPQQHAEFVQTMVPETATFDANRALQQGG
jgi:uncharacterized protein (TIGR00369 family)